MINASHAKVFYIVFVVFFSYFVLLAFYYLFLALVSLFEGLKRRREGEDEAYPLIYFSGFSMPVSVVIPARNEEEWIRDSVLSVLNQNYPHLELIIVDDGSTDKTFPILKDLLQLEPVDMAYIKHYKDGQVKETLMSRKYPQAVVIHKFAGLKKAGAVNAGLNIAKNEYVCVIDADTVLEPDALLKVMAHVARDPEGIIGIGSYFGLVNGFKIKNGTITERSFSYNPVIAYQNLEYIRSLIGNRIAWSRFDAVPVVAGGFSVWQREMLYELGGYSADFTCEDMELTFRAKDYSVKNKAKARRIVMLPYYVGWTEGPSNIGSLISQRERWQRVINETLWKYKYMLCNPRYGAFGFLTLPYVLMYEILGVFVELTSVVFVAVGWARGMLDAKIFFAFLALMLLVQSLTSALSLFAFIRTQRLFKIKYAAYLIFLSLIEFFFYRWIISLSKLIGTYKFLRGSRSFDRYTRARRGESA